MSWVAIELNDEMSEVAVVGAFESIEDCSDWIERHREVQSGDVMIARDWHVCPLNDPKTAS